MKPSELNANVGDWISRKHSKTAYKVSNFQGRLSIDCVGIVPLDEIITNDWQFLTHKEMKLGEPVPLSELAEGERLVVVCNNNQWPGMRTAPGIQVEILTPEGSDVIANDKGGYTFYRDPRSLLPLPSPKLDKLDEELIVKIIDKFDDHCIGVTQSTKREFALEVATLFEKSKRKPRCPEPDLG